MCRPALGDAIAFATQSVLAAAAAFRSPDGLAIVRLDFFQAAQVLDKVPLSPTCSCHHASCLVPHPASLANKAHVSPRHSNERYRNRTRAVCVQKHLSRRRGAAARFRPW